MGKKNQNFCEGTPPNFGYYWLLTLMRFHQEPPVCLRFEFRELSTNHPPPLRCVLGSIGENRFVLLPGKRRPILRRVRGSSGGELYRRMAALLLLPRLLFGVLRYDQGLLPETIQRGEARRLPYESSNYSGLVLEVHFDMLMPPVLWDSSRGGTWSFKVKKRVRF